ncbi:MAG: hypothetical protein Ta2E_07940 [Mycoplasmoidaceae bacterium]|nr:MAG: hypothetical protein Ta2E_07940 [Mycoplasmoidaceae bacterium]
MNNTNFKSKVFSRLFSILFCAVLLIGISIGSTSYYFITLPSKATKVELVKTSGPEILANKGDTMVFQSKIKNPKGLTTWKEPTPIPGVSYQYEDGGNTMVIEALNNLTTTMKINLEVINNDVSASCDVSINNIIYNPIPVNSNYFEFSSTDSENDTIQGFSRGVANNPWILVDNGYTSLDFSSSNIKYVAGDASFQKKVFDTWKVLKIDLSGLVFKFFEESTDKWHSGYKLFENYNFSSCIELNLSNADFASSANAQFSTSAEIWTGSYTFNGAMFNNLYSINLKNSIFASFSTNSTVTNTVTTGNNTFHEIYAPNAALLDLDGAIFAAENMNMSPSGYTFTGYNTFGKTIFFSLSVLKMHGTLFAAENMVNSSIFQAISIAYMTFYEANFSNGLRMLDLTETVFSAPNMFTWGVSGSLTEFECAHHTFSGVNFFSLVSLNLEGVNFIHKDIYAMITTSAILTFSLSNMCNLKTLNLKNTVFAAENMGMSRGGRATQSAVSTFSGCNMDSLMYLDLSSCIFATKNMNYANASTVSASNTFASCSFKSLIKINLSNVEFAAESMCDTGTIRTGYKMFDSADLSNVIVLDLSNTKFSTSNMVRSHSSGSIIYTADETFLNTKFSSLIMLDLSNTEFSSNNMVNSDVISGSQFHIFNKTFNGSELPILKTLDISNVASYYSTYPPTHTIGNLGFSNADLSECQDIYLYKVDDYNYKIFNSASVPTNGTIHWKDYSSTNTRPTMWDDVANGNSIFNSWTWTNNMDGGNS